LRHYLANETRSALCLKRGAHVEFVYLDTFQNHETYTGYALAIGAYTGSDDETVRFLSCSPPGPSIEVSGKFKLLTANGDEIDGEYVTTGTLDPVNGVSVQGGFRFLSGTGRFTHVRGSGVVEAHGVPSAPYEFVGTFTGIISYAGGARE